MESIVKILSFLATFSSCQKGATAIEYALIGTGISLAIIAAVFAFGDEVSAMYDGFADALQE